MPLWKVDGSSLKKFEVTDFSVANYEENLEEWLEANSDVIFDGEPIMWIGRQVHTEYGTIADLIGIDQDGRAVVVELKRDLTPRDIVAQALEYATWLAKLESDELASVAAQYFQRKDPRGGTSLRERFTDFFGDQDPPRFNRTQRVVLIGQEISNRVLDVAQFLRGYGLDIYCLQFTYHETDAGEKLLLTDMTVGDDEPGELARERDDQNSRQRNRQVAKMLCTELNQRFGSILQVPFQVYQERTGTAGDAHTTIQTDDFRMGIDFVVEGLEASVHVFSRLKTTRDAIVEWARSSGLLDTFEAAEFNPSQRVIVLIPLDLPTDSTWERHLVERVLSVARDILQRTGIAAPG